MPLLARIFLVIDIFRAAIVAPVIICILVEAACLRLDRLEENEPNRPKDHGIARGQRYDSRAMIIQTLLGGITVLSADILMALTLHKCLKEHLKLPYKIWLLSATGTLAARSYFYTYLWENEELLGFKILKGLTEETKIIMRILYFAAISYEGVKVFELVMGIRGLLVGMFKKRVD